MRGFNRFPLQVSHEDYSNLKGKTLYHGSTHEEYNASYLWDHQFHYGEGLYGNGYYTSTDKKDAVDYTTKGDVLCDENNLLKLKLVSLNYISEPELEKIIDALIAGEKNGYKINPHRTVDDFFETYGYTKKSEELLNTKLYPALYRLEIERAKAYKELLAFVDAMTLCDESYSRYKFASDLFCDNPSIVAAFLGFDATKINKKSHTHYIIHNRSAVIVDEKEVDRVMRLAGKNYNGLKYENNDMSNEELLLK